MKPKAIRSATGTGESSPAATPQPPETAATVLHAPIRAICFDWGGTLMSEEGPAGVPMALWPDVTVIPGAEECLAALHGHAPLCIATNAADSSRPMIERALHRGGLLRFISQVFCFTEVGFRKSEPEFWRAVHDALDVPLYQIVMVGDSLEQDVLASRRAGLQSVWLNRSGQQVGPPIPAPVVTHLDQFTRLVEDAIRPRPGTGSSTPA